MTGNIKERYIAFVDSIVRDKPYDVAMGEAVGGAPEVIGALELALLRYAGLRQDDYLIDIGCGSGRLTLPLSLSHKGRYLGTDLVPELLEYNKNRTNRPDWRFDEVDGLTIPEDDSRADMVCFFSVFTHLLLEQTFLYLEEALRVLRPGGLVVFSFLEIDVHWDVFLATVERERAGLAEQGVLNIFMDRSDIHIYAELLGFNMVEMRSGTDQFIPLLAPLIVGDGRTMHKFGGLGQSVCVLQKPIGNASKKRTYQDYVSSDHPTKSDELQRISLELQQIYTSRSWAWTRPLRLAEVIFK